jgi:hypothetical protein
MHRSCTNCAVKGLNVPAVYVACSTEPGTTGEPSVDICELVWFECENHGDRDNAAGVVRSRREPIDEFFARLQVPVEILEIEPPPPTERTVPPSSRE